MSIENNIAVSSGAFNPLGLSGKPPVEAATSFIYMEEIWLPIKGFEESHMISNLGRIKSLPRMVNCRNGFRSVKEKILSSSKRNYQQVQFKHNGEYFQIHRLVAIAFIPNTLNKPCVNHIDGNPKNNHVSNLEWCTYSENELHSYRKLGKKPTLSNLNHYDKKWESDFVCVNGKNFRSETRKYLLNLLNNGGIIVGNCTSMMPIQTIYDFVAELKRIGVVLNKDLIKKKVIRYYLP